MMDLRKKQKKLLEEIYKHGDILKGSINAVCNNCNRANCICSKKSNEKVYRLTYKDNNQKTKIVYIPKKYLNEVNYMISNFTRLREIINQLIELNIEIFKKKSQE